MSNVSRSNGNKNAANFIQILIVAVFVLAAISIASAVGAFYQDPQSLEAYYFFAVGLIAMCLAGYILFQSRKRMAKLNTEPAKIITTINCPTCNQKITRDFQRGDYIFKDDEKCPKCQGTGMIVAIYREVKEKEKEKSPNI